MHARTNGFRFYLAFAVVTAVVIILSQIPIAYAAPQQQGSETLSHCEIVSVGQWYCTDSNGKGYYCTTANNPDKDKDCRAAMKVPPRSKNGVNPVHTGGISDPPKAPPKGRGGLAPTHPVSVSKDPTTGGGTTIQRSTAKGRDADRAHGSGGGNTPRH